MKKLALWLGIVALVVGGGIAAFWPSNHFRLYDANLRPLAMTEAEAYCVGEIGATSQWKENDPDVIACVAASERETVPNITMTPAWFCSGVMITIPGAFASVQECVDVVDGYELWPLLDGGITFEWNAAHPRPSNVQTIIERQPARAGERDTESRGDFN